MFENVEVRPTEAIHHALSLGSDQKIVKLGGKKEIGRWTAPRVGFLKLNVDGAIFCDQQKTGVGVL